MRRTKKYQMAQKCIFENVIDIGDAHENEDVFNALEEQNYFWFPKEGEWQLRDNIPSTSVFQDDDGTPTGIVKIRIMCHPYDLKQAISEIKNNQNFQIADISDPYPNRNGAGVRVYITAKMQWH